MFFFLKANILEGSLNILFPVVYMNRTKAAWSSITVGPYVYGKTTERGSLSHRFSCTLELFSFSKKKNEPRQDCSSTYDFLSCAGPRSSHQRQWFSTSHVVYYTWVRPQQLIHRPHPAERARCWIDRYRLVLIGTSIIFFECLTIVCLLVLRWKRGRELVHCLYNKLQTCLPTSRRPAKPYLFNEGSFKFFAIRIRSR